MVGNLISNTVIVVVSLSHSLDVAIGSLAFLVVIHKLEYFVNARIVGTADPRPRLGAAARHAGDGGRLRHRRRDRRADLLRLPEGRAEEPGNDLRIVPALPSLAQLDQAAAVVYQAMLPTAQHCWPLLCEALGTEAWVKHENHAPIGAFKVRGGLAYFRDLAQRGERVNGVISAPAETTGNRSALPHAVTVCRSPS